MGLDFAPYMIALAKEEAQRRNSSVNFVEADIFKRDFGRECFDLITCFGNSISDFPLLEFSKLDEKITDALKPGGRFAIEYMDGFYRYIMEDGRQDMVYQEKPERITRCFKGYLPEIGAIVGTIRNETRGEEYDRKGYIYTPPMVQLVMGNYLELERHFELDKNQFLDVFVKAGIER